MGRHRKIPMGFSLTELLVIVAGLAVLAAATFPLMAGAMQRARARGAAETLAAAIRDARTRAIATGWQYRVVAFDVGGAVPNAVRIEGIDPSAPGPPPWPLATATIPPAFYGPTQVYEPYEHLARTFGGTQVEIPGGGSAFAVTFDSRGQWAVPCVPVGCQVQVNTHGRQATITVSQAGTVLVAK